MNAYRYLGVARLLDRGSRKASERNSTAHIITHVEDSFYSIYYGLSSSSDIVLLNMCAASQYVGVVRV
jgi:hypothetical protein